MTLLTQLASEDYLVRNGIITLRLSLAVTLGRAFIHSTHKSILVVLKQAPPTKLSPSQTHTMTTTLASTIQAARAYSSIGCAPGLEPVSFVDDGDEFPPRDDDEPFPDSWPVVFMGEERFDMGP